MGCGWVRRKCACEPDRVPADVARHLRFGLPAGVEHQQQCVQHRVATWRELVAGGYRERHVAQQRSRAGQPLRQGRFVGEQTVGDKRRHAARATRVPLAMRSAERMAGCEQASARYATPRECASRDQSAALHAKKAFESAHATLSMRRISIQLRPRRGGQLAASCLACAPLSALIMKKPPITSLASAYGPSLASGSALPARRCMPPSSASFSPETSRPRCAIPLPP
jgi:hypothetical protein